MPPFDVYCINDLACCCQFAGVVCAHHHRRGCQLGVRTGGVNPPHTHPTPGHKKHGHDQSCDKKEYG